MGGEGVGDAELAQDPPEPGGREDDAAEDFDDDEVASRDALDGLVPGQVAGGGQAAPTRKELQEARKEALSVMRMRVVRMSPFPTSAASPMRM